ncbi:hypothetical protein ACIBSV_05090 [Embleya sp. NPDC050154]|uniref:hypothetical protein n=1 Tax=Embleya sp. NPDC050154 TaxID=3363988 RepID=UPI003793012B
MVVEVRRLGVSVEPAAEFVEVGDHQQDRDREVLGNASAHGSVFLVPMSMGMPLSQPFMPSVWLRIGL